jgi:hypothetical protein
VRIGQAGETSGAEAGVGGAGTVSTADGEARDITSFAASSASRTADKDVARTEQLLQRPARRG